MTCQDHEFVMYEPKSIAGRYKIFPGFYVDAFKKPNVLHRIFTRLLLGWVWEDWKNK